MSNSQYVVLNEYIFDVGCVGIQTLGTGKFMYAKHVKMQNCGYLKCVGISMYEFSKMLEFKYVGTKNMSTRKFIGN